MQSGSSGGVSATSVGDRVVALWATIDFSYADIREFESARSLVSANRWVSPIALCVSVAAEGVPVLSKF
jgi:hypothetical protein